MSRVRTHQSRQARRVIRCHGRRGATGNSPAIGPVGTELAAHGEEVAAIAARVAEEVDLSPVAIDHLRLAGLLHDIGKLWVPSRILEKEWPLTVAESTVMQKHPENGALMLQGYGLDQEAQWVLYHHERPDGLGYPFGLVGEDIPLESRILALADAWSAMRSDRPHSAPLTNRSARCELEYTSGEQFDSMLVDVFLDRVEPYLETGRVPRH